MKFFIAICLLIPLVAQAESTTTPLEYEVIRSSTHSFNANSILIKGKNKAILIDAPYTRSDAHRVVAAILESGKELEAIYITHNHPDHYYSVEVIRQAFPNARYVSHPDVVKAIWRSLPFKQARWTKILGVNGPQFPTAPWPLDSDTLELEGHEIKILGPMQGDHHSNTVVWIPSLKALFTSDMVHNQVVLWFVEHTPEQIEEYGRSVDKLIALKPEIVVPGHEKEGMPHDRSGLVFTKAYIDAWPKLVAQAKNSEELVQLVKKAFPDAVDPNGDFAVRTSAKVAMGEEAAWDD